MQVRTAFCKFTWLTSATLAVCGSTLGWAPENSPAQAASSAVFVTDDQPERKQEAELSSPASSLVITPEATLSEATPIATQIANPNVVQQAAYQEPAASQNTQSSIQQVEHRQTHRTAGLERAERMQNRVSGLSARGRRTRRSAAPAYLKDAPQGFSSTSQPSAIPSGEAKASSPQGIENECNQRLLWAHKLSQTADSVKEFATISEQCEEVLTFDVAADDDRIQFARELCSWALNRRGQLALDQGEQQLAEADFDRAIELNDRNWRALHNRAVSEAQKRNFAEAFDDFCSVIRLRPQHAKAYTNRATLYVEAGDLQSAAKDYRRAVEIDPDVVSAHLGLARTCHQLGRWDEAHRAYDNAIALDSENAVTYCSRGDLRADIGLYAEALSDYAHTIALEPEFAHAYRNGAWLLATCPRERFRDVENALQGAHKALESNYGERHAALDTLAAAMANAGRFDEAVETVQQAIELAPDSARDAYVARLSLYQQGQPFRTEPAAEVHQASFESDSSNR